MNKEDTIQTINGVLFHEDNINIYAILDGAGTVMFSRPSLSQSLQAMLGKKGVYHG
jgi:hypothetical protein